MRLSWGTAPLTLFDLIEIGLTMLCLVIAFVRPGLGQRWFCRIETFLLAFSKQPKLCIVLLFLLPILFRVILLPVYAPPVPYISDEYAYLLQADTFASGRLTNPSPPMWQHFTSVYVLASPTYTAEYQVGQGMVLALGEMLAGVPWVGVLLSVGVMCAVIYWSLLAWLPSVWAFAGTLIIVDLQLGVLSYWMNSYWGGCVPAVGGALALGGLVRLREDKPVLFSFVTSTGLIILFNSRPLEGLLLTAIAVAAIGYWTFVSKQMPARRTLARVLPCLALSGVLATAFAGYYNQRVTGSAFQFPYLLYRSEYGMPQGFFWQKPIHLAIQLPADIQSEYEDQLQQHERSANLTGLAAATFGKLRRFWEFYIGVPLTVVLAFLPFVGFRRRRVGFRRRRVGFRRRRVGFLLPNMGVAWWALCLVLFPDNLLFFAFFPHYAAAVIVVIVLLLIQGIRSMRVSGSSGLFLSRALPLVCVVGLLLPMCGRWIEGMLPTGLDGIKRVWSSEFFHEVSRERFVPQLEREPGKQLVLVRYQPYGGGKKHEWIYNLADLQKARIVWARDSNDPQTVKHLELRYPGRKLWRAEPDAVPPRILPYPQTSGDLK